MAIQPCPSRPAVAGYTRRAVDGLVNAVQSAHPGGRVLSIDLPQGPHSPVRATVAYASDDWRSVLVDPHTARVIGTLGEFGVARFFRSFHKQLYIYPGSLPHGVYAVGPLGVVLLLSLGTGLLFYRFRWRDLLMRGPWVNRRAFWSALHRATGMWVIPVAIVITATGVWYLVERVLQDASIRIPVGQVLRSTPTAPADAGGAWPIAIDDAVARAEQAVPNLRVQSVSFSNDARRWLTLTGQTDAWLVRDEANSVRLDPYSGQIQEVMVAAGLHPITRLAHTADILHFGTFGGLATKILWLVIGLFMSTAILLGVRVWYLRVVASSLPDPARASSAPAALAVTVIVLGVSVYGSVVNIGESLDIRRTVSFASLGGVSLGSSIVRVKAAVVDDKLQVVGAGTQRDSALDVPTRVDLGRCRRSRRQGSGQRRTACDRMARRSSDTCVSRSRGGFSFVARHRRHHGPCCDGQLADHLRCQQPWHPSPRGARARVRLGGRPAICCHHSGRVHRLVLVDPAQPTGHGART